MNLTTFILLTAALLLASCSAGEQKSTASQLKDVEWENRVLLIHKGSDNAQNAAFEKQLADLEAQLTDRDLITITADAVAQKRYKIPAEELTVILIGKDGGVKDRQIGEIDISRFFPLIDSMPMRRREMQGRSGQ